VGDVYAVEPVCKFVSEANAHNWDRATRRPSALRRNRANDRRFLFWYVCLHCTRRCNAFIHNILGLLPASFSYR
jgi:hypothetical protein